MGGMRGKVRPRMKTVVMKFKGWGCKERTNKKGIEDWLRWEAKGFENKLYVDDVPFQIEMKVRYPAQ